MNFKVLITKAIPEEGLVELKKHCEIIMPDKGFSFSREEMLNFAPVVDAVIVCKSKIDEEFIKYSKKLKIISVLGVGYDSVSMEAANRKKILITNNPKTVTESTAELTFAIMLALTRRIVEADSYVRCKNDHNWHFYLFNGNELFGKKIGIIGFGRIGEAVAKRCLAFGMKVYYFDLFAKKNIEIDVKALSFEELMSSMDYITLHVPYNKETHHLIDQQELINMKKSAYLINVSRGAVVNQKALIDALKNREIAGAALDVFETEPLVPKDLLELSNVVLTPHIGSSTIETRIAMARESARKVIQTLKGDIPDDLVNKGEIGKV